MNEESYAYLARSDAQNVCGVINPNRTILSNIYNGIPETLALNTIGYIILILLFTVLRQQAWDYGRLALVNSNGGNKRWTQIFYAHGTDIETPSIETSRNGNNILGGQQTIVDRGFFSWISLTLRLKKDQIFTHSGPDAVHYLSFQLHLMIVMAIMTFISIVIILPVNFQGVLLGDINTFGHTTISNLPANSSLLWVHVIVAIFYVPLVVLVMRRASGRNAFKTAPTRTIMATNISTSDCNRATIRNYIQELFPDLEIQDIELAYNISKLTEIVEEYERAMDARIYCEVHKNRKEILAQPNCFTCKTVDALEYYKEREIHLSGEVARLRASSLNDPLGIAFITVSSTSAAQNIIAHFKPGTYREWTLAYAPAPSDIFWHHLNVSSGRWYIRWAFINFILFLFLFFLTTPIYIVNLLDTYSLAKNTIGKVSPLISEFLPTLLLWTLAALLPVAVSFSDRFLNHWTRSKQNYSIMTKSFGYLLFMILILPSLGLTSAQAFFTSFLHYNDGNVSFRWECIFLPDKGAFFVNYVITASLIGTALELLRFPELIVYIWFLCTSKSIAETPYIRRSILIEFPFGIHYAWTIMVFTMTTVYSVVCPLIMPFGMIYICLKHFGDRHNLFFAYGPSNMISQGGGKIHSTAVTMTKFSVILLLIILAALTTVRQEGIDPRAVVLIITLCITLTLFTFMSPIKKCTTKRPSIHEAHGPAPIYIAKVLQPKRLTLAETISMTGGSSVGGAGTSSSGHHLGYGSDTTSIDVGDSSEDAPMRHNNNANVVT